MKEKILLLLTGGTIGSAIDDKSIDISQATGDDLITFFNARYPDPVDFEVVRPFQILSENAEPDHWLSLIETINHYDLSQYAGVMIAHGSDTLPYTAAALSYGLNTPSLPILLVASNFPLGEVDSNALDNFTASVDFILNLKIPGIFTLYKNSNGELHVHLGTRLCEADWLKDDFQSFGGSLGLYNDKGFCYHPLTTNPTMPELYQPALDIVPEVASFQNQVLALRAYPGLDYSCIDTKPFRAVLHSLYHSASGNVTGKNGRSLKEFIADNRQLDHYMISYKNTKGNLYASSHKLIAAGGIPIENISFEAALTKLFFAYNQNESSPSAYLNREFFHEFVRERVISGYVL